VEIEVRFSATAILGERHTIRPSARPPVRPSARVGHNVKASHQGGFRPRPQLQSRQPVAVGRSVGRSRRSARVVRQSTQVLLIRVQTRWIPPCTRGDLQPSASRASLGNHHPRRPLACLTSRAVVCRSWESFTDSITSKPLPPTVYRGDDRPNGRPPRSLLGRPSADRCSPYPPPVLPSPENIGRPRIATSDIHSRPTKISTAWLQWPRKTCHREFIACTKAVELRQVRSPIKCRVWSC